MNTEELGTAGYCAVVLNNIQLLQFDKKYERVYVRYEEDTILLFDKREH